MSSHAQLNKAVARESADRHVFVVCSGENCRSHGSEGLLDLLRHERCAHHAENTDVRVAGSRACIGHCAAAPAMVEDGRVLGWVTLRRLRSELMRLGLFAPAAGA